MIGEPCTSGGGGGGDDGHPRRPEIGLPNIAVGFLEQETLSGRFFEETRALADVRIDPNTNLQSALVQTTKHAFGVGKHASIPFEITPIEFPHPEAIEVENV